MDPCTVTAPDAITAFAVPNPSGTFAEPPVFSGSIVQRIASPLESPKLLWTSDCFISLTLSPVDARNTSIEPKAVNTHYRCSHLKSSGIRFQCNSTLSTLFAPSTGENTDRAHIITLEFCTD